MTSLNEWRLFQESLAGGRNLGLSKPQTVGFIGSNLQQEWEDDEDDEDDDKKKFDGEHLEDDEDDEDDGKEGDLVGSSDADEGPTKNWPPDGEDGEDTSTPDDPSFGADDFGDEEGDDDFLASIGAGGGGKDVGGDDQFGGDEFGGDQFGDDMGGDQFGGDDDFLASLGDDAQGEVPQGGQGEDMGFLDNIPTDLFGGDMAGDEMGGDLGGDQLGGDMGAEGEPCPDCNSDGGEEMGDPQCQLCGGMGFLDMPEGDLGDELTDGPIDDLGGDDLDGDVHAHAGTHGHDDEMNSYMNKMAQYMQRFMKKEWAALQEMGPVSTVPQQGQMQPQQQMVPQRAPMQMMPQQQGQRPNDVLQGPFPPAPANPVISPMKKKMVKFMSKGGERSFMAADSKTYRKPGFKKHCPCESSNEYQCSDSDFLKSLSSGARRAGGGSSGITEDALFALAQPGAEYAQGEEQAGTIGFAPQGRIGSIGGGYTQQDVQDLPTLGESRRYPTLAEYAAMKAKKSASKKRR